MKITDKQKRFVDYYVSEECFGNGSRAAVKAGYAPGSATVTATRLLAKDNISRLIAKKMQKALEKTEMLTADWLRRIKILASANIRDLIEWDSDEIKLRPSSDLTDDEAYTVSEISQTITRDGGSIRIKTVPKDKALDMLGKYLALYEEKVTLMTPEDSVIELGARERRVRLAELLEKRNAKTSAD